MQGLRPEILAGIPDNMYNIVRRIEDSFAISTPDLRKLANHFEEQLQRGLTLDGSDIPMNVTWVMGYPTGKEKGRYLSIDFGGTYVRVCNTLLQGREKDFQITQEKYKLPIHLRTTTAEKLWDFVAYCVGDFIEKHREECESQRNESGRMPLAFTFSYPVTQTSIRDGILQKWTKALTVSGVEGHDIVSQFQAALDRRKVPVDIVALVNDTMGALVSSNYRDPEVKISSVISTGCNAAYMEDYRAVSKIESYFNPDQEPADRLIGINTELGAYDNSRHMLPLTHFDETVDQLSAHPGSQMYEKLVAGLYLGEIYRIILIELHGLGMLSPGKDVSILEKADVIDASFLSVAEADMSRSLDEIKELFKDKLHMDLTPDEVKVCRYLVELVGTRAARLYACSIAAICRRLNVRECRVGADGSVFHKYTHFKDRSLHALREILDWPYFSEDYVTFHDAEDGSGVGAAIIAAMVLQKDGGGTLGPKTGY